MHMLTLENISKSYGVKSLFSGVTLGIEKGDKIGLIGVNGAGKSSLLKIIAGWDSPDTGSVVKGNGITVHYVPQQPVFDERHSVLEAVLDGELPVMQVLKRYEEAVHQLELDKDCVAKQEAVMRLSEEMDRCHGWELEQQAKMIISRLGFDDSSVLVNTLSGGQAKRLGLARALLVPCDVLILDEPTNHLDEWTIEWLEQFLKGRKGALIVSTHDRYFLDAVTNVIVELDRGKVYRYEGNYGVYLEKKEERLEQEESSEAKRQNRLRQEKAWISRGAQARSTKQKARIERYERLVAMEKTKRPGTMEVLDVSSRLGRSILSLQEMSFGYEGKPVLFQPFSYEVVRHDRIGIVGKNGVGKTSFLRLLAGEILPSKGEVIKGSTVKLAYFHQGIPPMDERQRVIEFIREKGRYITNQYGQTISASQLLEQFLFPSEMQWIPIGKLSGGERRRLYLLRLLMDAPNVFLMDEPTNDLDIPTLTVLEQYLDQFQGVVIVVSHDRYFLDRVVDKLFVIEESKIERYYGDYSDYMEERRKKEGAAAVRVEKKVVEPERQSPKVRKLTLKEQEELAYITKELPNYERMVKGLALAIAGAGSDFAKIEGLLEEQKKVQEKVDEMTERWLVLQEIAEESTI